MSTAVSLEESPAAETPGWLAALGGTWPEWKKRLAKKRYLERLAKGLGGNARCALTWALPGPARGETKKLIERLAKLRRGKPVTPKLLRVARQWLDEIGQRPADESVALECLAWTRALPALSGDLAPELWGELLGTVRQLAQDAAAIPFGQMPLARQLQAGELPLTLAFLFPGSPALEEQGEAGAGCVMLGMRELLDGEGMLHGRAIDSQRSLLACWTRALRMARLIKSLDVEQDVWSDFEWFLRQSLRLTRYDGAQMLNPGKSGKWNAELFRAALALDDDKEDLAAAKLLPWGKGEAPKLKSRAKPPQPGSCSEWAELAVMRSGWLPGEVAMAAAFAGSELQVELNAAGRTWLAGAWGFDLQIDGRQLQPQGTINELCWHADEDVEYLELEAPFADQWSIQRQILVDRRHQFVYAADAVQGPGPADITCRVTLPLAGSVKVAAAKETRELSLKSGKMTVDALPLALPEWRADRVDGTLEGEPGRLQLSQSARQVSRLYAPLVLLLHPNRSRKLTWRQLTVAENLQIRRPDAACGYRLQSGEFHWLFYRSLAEVAPRTVLGQHLNNEFFAARFLPDGGVEELLEIEGPAD